MTLKRNFTKTYRQQNAELNKPNENIEFNFGENINFCRRGNGYFQFHKELTRNGVIFEDDITDVIRLVKTAFSSSI